jgi:hypothetical protein
VGPDDGKTLAAALGKAPGYDLGLLNAEEDLVNFLNQDLRFRGWSDTALRPFEQRVSKLPLKMAKHPAS